MVLEYSLTGSRRRKYILFPVMKLLIVIVIATILGVLWFDIRNEQLLMVVGLAWAWVFLIHLLPLLIMVIRHNQLSSGSCFVLDTRNTTYHYWWKDKSLSFRLAEVDKVIKVVSPPKYDRRIDILGFGYFYYWSIVLMDGRTLSISCMLLDVDVFPEKMMSQEKRLFPIPPSNRLFKSGETVIES